MPVTVVTGTATHVALGSETTYAANAQYGPIPQHNHALTMRINGRVVFFRTRTMPSISDGDQVAVAGSEKNGTFQALALRNLTTGAMYCPPTIMVLILAAVLILIGIPLIAFLGFGLLFVGVGVWALLRALRVRKAASMLLVVAAPAPVAA